MVDFEYLNLVADEYPTLFSMTNAMDLILCRNVLMYFNARYYPAGRRKAPAARCCDEGWLVVSPVESPLITDAALSAVQFPDAFPSANGARAPAAAVESSRARDVAAGCRSRGQRPMDDPRPSRGPGPRLSGVSAQSSPVSSGMVYADALEHFVAARYDTCVSLLVDPSSGTGGGSEGA